MAPMPDAPLFIAAGTNPVRLFGLEVAERARRIAANAGFAVADAPEPGRAALVASSAFAWDPAWLKALAGRPGSVLTLGGKAVLAHVPAGGDPAAIARAMADGPSDPPAGFERIPAESAELTNAELRKRERAFVLAIDESSREAAERAAYDGAYKGVTDALTLYLWRRPAFHLTRWAAEAGLSPNMVTAAGAFLCVLAFWLFWNGDYWPGLAAGFAFMVLDTVDGKLARCTGQSSKWGNVFDHGIDLIHPPFWYWAWAHGLDGYGTPLEPVYATTLLWAIVGGYVLQRLIEGEFIRRFDMHIHVWRPIDSRFRLVTARRNPNMAILVVAMLLARPDVGLELVALWTILSLIFHAVRLAQASVEAERGRALESWLA